MKLPPGFDLNSVEVFMLTAESGGMTQTAQHLGTTQSAVSQTISKLEAALGVRLFDRAMRPMALTPSGKLLLRDGSQLIADAKALVREVREGGERPAECVTLAMAESIANHLTAPLLQQMGNRAIRWQLRSGISLLQHHEFVARKLDMLITGSSQLEDVPEIEHFPIMTEDFVLVAPADHPVQPEPIEALAASLPFIRYSLLSAMGQTIERQVTRMRLRLANSIEVDATLQQLSAVAAGVGWSITTPLCLASHAELLPQLRVMPMGKAQFRRQIQLIVRRGEFGSLPNDIATMAARTLQDACREKLSTALPWIPTVLSQPNAALHARVDI
jgi:DNA-binding transcriptional LysR family regulator